MADQQLRAIKAARLCVVNLHEDDTGMWFCTLAATYRSPMETWKTGKGQTADDAMDNALGLAYLPRKAKAHSSEVASQPPAEAPRRRRRDEDDIL
jgi:hypothetical protein